MTEENIIIIGAGPCGMACALELQKKGENPLIIEKGNVAQTISNFPTHQTFFSSSDRLEIGNVPFISENQKPVRNQAMVYYREVASRNKLRIHAFEKLTSLEKDLDRFLLKTVKRNGTEKMYHAKQVIMATGYYDQPNYMDVPGESLPKVSHYFKEAHEYFNQNVAVIGGKNSTVDATLELHKAGANVTIIYRGDTYSKSIKPWILPEFETLVRNKRVEMVFNASVKEITETHLTYEKDGSEVTIENDFVFAMTGYRPDYRLLKQVGVEINAENGKPVHNENTMETNIENLYIAGVVAAGYDNNKVFIENGRFHGELIAKAMFSDR